MTNFNGQIQSSMTGFNLPFSEEYLRKNTYICKRDIVQGSE